MKKYLVILLCYTLNTPVYAAFVTHTDYQSGATITASGQNANENAIIAQINGNIDNTNILAGSILGSNIAANTVVYSNLAVPIQSTITIVQQTLTYRAPNLIFTNNKQVTAENNTGTSNQTCIMFPSGQRCTTASGERLLDVTTHFQRTSVYASGLATGYILTNQTWYSIYAITATDSVNDFVLVADTVQPVAANITSLNTTYGTNQWKYLGSIAYGNNTSATPNQIVNFAQSGAYTVFLSSVPSTTATTGIDLKSSASNTVVSWTYATGSIVGTNVPANVSIGWVTIENAPGVSQLELENAAGDRVYFNWSGASGTSMAQQTFLPLTGGLSAVGNTNNELYLLLTGYVDNALKDSMNQI